MSGGAVRVLVVEDERELASILVQALQEAGFATDVAYDGEEGQRLATSYPVDAVVLDLLLPKKHGLAVLKSVKKARPELPVLVLTALDMLEEKVEGLTLGADDYLTKPFSVVEVVARVRALLRRASGLEGAVVRVGDLVVDLAKRKVERAGRTIELTPREQQLLVFLLHHRARPVTRTDIGEHVYERDFEANSNAIDVAIGNLRSKIGSPALIHSIRGVGYVLEAREDAP